MGESKQPGRPAARGLGFRVQGPSEVHSSRVLISHSELGILRFRSWREKIGLVIKGERLLCAGFMGELPLGSRLRRKTKLP